jgi:hypothetical protein
MVATAVHKASFGWHHNFESVTEDLNPNSTLQQLPLILLALAHNAFAMHTDTVHCLRNGNGEAEKDGGE